MTENPDEPVMVMSNFASVADARTLGERLVGQRLAASVNILPATVSIYEWQGRLVHDSEATMIAKTTARNVAAVIAALEREHPYDLPAVVVMPIRGGSKAYLEWIARQSDGTVAPPGDD